MINIINNIYLMQFPKGGDRLISINQQVIINNSSLQGEPARVVFRPEGDDPHPNQLDHIEQCMLEPRANNVRPLRPQNDKDESAPHHISLRYLSSEVEASSYDDIQRLEFEGMISRCKQEFAKMALHKLQNSHKIKQLQAIISQKNRSDFIELIAIIEVKGRKLLIVAKLLKQNLEGIDLVYKGKLGIEISYGFQEDLKSKQLCQKFFVYHDAKLQDYVNQKEQKLIAELKAKLKKIAEQNEKIEQQIKQLKQQNQSFDKVANKIQGIMIDYAWKIELANLELAKQVEDEKSLDKNQDIYLSQIQVSNDESIQQLEFEQKIFYCQQEFSRIEFHRLQNEQKIKHLEQKVKQKNYIDSVMKIIEDQGRGYQFVRKMLKEKLERIDKIYQRKIEIEWDDEINVRSLKLKQIYEKCGVYKTASINVFVVEKETNLLFKMKNFIDEAENTVKSQEEKQILRLKHQQLVLDKQEKKNQDLLANLIYQAGLKKFKLQSKIKFVVKKQSVYYFEPENNEDGP